MISRQGLSLGLSNFQKFYFANFPGFMTQTYSSRVVNSCKVCRMRVGELHSMEVNFGANYLAISNCKAGINPSTL